MEIEGEVKEGSRILLRQRAEAMNHIVASYRKSSKQWSATLNKLAQVRQSGRKRTMDG